MHIDSENHTLSTEDPVFNSQNLLNDIIHFKDNILKEIKQLDTKFSYKYSNIQTLMQNKFSSYDNKFNDVTSIIDSINKSVSEIISQKEKISKLESFRLKTEETLITQNFNIKTLSKKYEEILEKNDKANKFLYPGVIGINCKFQSFKNFVDYILESVGNLLSFKEKTIIEVKDNKNKTELINYGLKASINNALTTCTNFTSKSLNQLEEKLNNKIKECETKFEEAKFEKNNLSTISEEKLDNLKSEIYKIDEKCKNINSEIEKLLEINKKNETYINENNEKLKTVNGKFNEISKEFNSLKNDYNKYYKNNISYISLERKKSNEENLSQKNIDRENDSNLFNSSTSQIFLKNKIEGKGFNNITQYEKFAKLTKNSRNEKIQTLNNFHFSSSVILDNNINMEKNKEKNINNDKNNKQKETIDDILVTYKKRENLYNSEKKNYKLDKYTQSKNEFSYSTININPIRTIKAKNIIGNNEKKSFLFPSISGNKNNNQSPNVKENKISINQKNDNNNQIVRKINDEECNNQINTNKNNNLIIITNISQLNKSKSVQEFNSTKSAGKKDENLDKTKKIIRRKILMEDNEEKIFTRLFKKMIEFKRDNISGGFCDKNKKYAEIYNKVYEVQSVGNCLNDRRQSSNYYLDLMINDDLIKDN